MAIWSKMGLSGPAAAAGAAAVIVIIGGTYLITQRGADTPSAANEVANENSDEVATQKVATEEVQVPKTVTPAPQVDTQEEVAVAEPEPEPVVVPDVEPEPVVNALAEPEPETAPEPKEEAVADAATEPEVEPAPEAVADAVAEPAPEREVAIQPEAEPETDTVQTAPDPEPEAEPETEISEVTPEPTTPEALSVTPPAFDVVQVAPDGGGVIAGTAEPGHDVVFLLDGSEIARGKANASGKFGVLLDFPASDTPRALSIIAEAADGTQVASEGTVLISPVKLPEPEPAPEPQAVVDVAQAPAIIDPAPDAEQPAPSTEASPVPESLPVTTAETKPEAKLEVQPEVEQVAEAEPERAPDAPAVVLADNTGISVLQPAPRPSVPQLQEDAPVVENVVIDTISYDAVGDVALAGRGASQGFVRVYLNDQPIRTSRIEDDGAWEAPLPNVDAGVYRLRVDEVDADGVVTSRVETPFQREAPEVATANPQTATAVTVQPGFTLWAIARDRFGSGEQYVRVYEANRDLIRDPDLIYPGQVFALPEG